jgi:mRNA interferase MazF
VVVHRGEIWWADLAEPRGSEPGFRHPVLILQSEPFNRSRLPTVVGVIVSSNTRLLDAPGNVLLRSAETGLPRDSVANVSQFVTVDRDYLEERAGSLGKRTLSRVERGVRLLLDL